MTSGAISLATGTMTKFKAGSKRCGHSELDKLVKIAEVIVIYHDLPFSPIRSLVMFDGYVSLPDLTTTNDLHFMYNGLSWCILMKPRNT